MTMTPDQWADVRRKAAEVSMTLNRGLRRLDKRAKLEALPVTMALADVAANTIITSAQITGLPVAAVRDDLVRMIGELLAERAPIVVEQVDPAPAEPSRTQH